MTNFLAFFLLLLNFSFPNPDLRGKMNADPDPQIFTGIKVCLFLSIKSINCV